LPLVEFTEKGFYVPQADCYIDPEKKVPTAIITHGHSDHARRGCGKYYATPLTASIIKFRYSISKCETFEFNEAFEINGVQFSFHPAGHVAGSAQVRIEYRGEVWVITGDYKRAVDRVCKTFEVVPCDHFVTECTFGMPIYRWKSETELTEQIRDWWVENQKNYRASLLMGYSLGKAQRLMQMIEDPIGPIYCHPTVYETNEVIAQHGIPFHENKILDGIQSFDDLSQSLIIAPGSAVRSDWAKSIGDFSPASASGWNQTRRRRRGQADRHFVISDHADWPELIQTVHETGAHHIYVMHGFTETFGAHLRDLGFDAQTVSHRLNQSSI